MTYFFGEFVVTIWGPYDFGTSTPTPWFCHNLRGQKSSSSQFPRGWRGRGWGTHGAPVYHLGRGTCAGLAESGLQKPLQKGFILHIWAISYRGLSWSQAKWWFLYTRNLPQSCSEVSWDTLKSEVCKNSAFQLWHLKTSVKVAWSPQRLDWWRPVLTESSPYITQFRWKRGFCMFLFPSA